jgi:hypothetical protein
MAFVNDFKFNTMSRIGNDHCGLSQSNVQNVEASNYILTNHFSSDCNMSNGISTALTQPNINFSGTHQTGMGGCGIDTNSKLLIESPLSRHKCKISLYQRPFLTVPFLGKGTSNPMLESQLQQGDRQTNKKSVVNSSEQSHIPLHHTPMIPSLAATVTNPVNLVEGVAADGWIRGGVPSRELAKDEDYFQ